MSPIYKERFYNGKRWTKAVRASLTFSDLGSYQCYRRPIFYELRSKINSLFFFFKNLSIYSNRWKIIWLKVLITLYWWVVGFVIVRLLVIFIYFLIKLSRKNGFWILRKVYIGKHIPLINRVSTTLIYFLMLKYFSFIWVTCLCLSYIFVFFWVDFRVCAELCVGVYISMCKRIPISCIS